MRRAASATIISGVTASLRKNRVRRISPDRLPPSRRTRRLRPPVSTRRACKKAPLFPGGDRQTAPAHIPPFIISQLNQQRESKRTSSRNSKCVNAVARLNAGVSRGEFDDGPRPRSSNIAVSGAKFATRDRSPECEAWALDPTCRKAERPIEVFAQGPDRSASRFAEVP